MLEKKNELFKVTRNIVSKDISFSEKQYYQTFFNSHISTNVSKVLEGQKQPTRGIIQTCVLFCQKGVQVISQEDHSHNHRI